jgi:hypothetical protein
MLVLFPNITVPERLRVARDTHPHDPELKVHNGRVRSGPPLPGPSGRHFTIELGGTIESLEGTGLVNLSKVSAGVGGTQAQRSLLGSLLKDRYGSEEMDIVVTRVEFQPGRLCFTCFGCTWRLQHVGSPPRNMIRSVFVHYDLAETVRVGHRSLDSESLEYTVLEPINGTKPIGLDFGNHPRRRDDRGFHFRGHYNLMDTPQQLGGRFPAPETKPCEGVGPRYANPQCSPAQIDP